MFYQETYFRSELAPLVHCWFYAKYLAPVCATLLARQAAKKARLMFHIQFMFALQRHRPYRYRSGKIKQMLNIGRYGSRVLHCFWGTYDIHRHGTIVQQCWGRWARRKCERQQQPCVTNTQYGRSFACDKHPVHDLDLKDEFSLLPKP